MSRFQYEVAGQIADVVVPDTLDDFYRGDAKYTEVTGDGIPLDEAQAAAAEAAERAEVEQQVAELTGPALDKAVRDAKVVHPSNLTADEKRAALVDATLAPTDDNTNED